MKHHHPGDELLLLAMDPDDQGSNRLLARVASHVEDCLGCQARAAELKATAAEAQRLYRQTGAPGVAHAVGRERLERTLQQAAQTAEPSWWTRVSARGDLTTGLAVAASLAALVLASLVIPRAPGAQPAQQPGQERAGGPLPVAALTPGAVSTLTAEELCAGRRTSRTVPDAVRRRVLAGYGMEHTPADRYELDALVTLDLGGTVAPENLWPQPYASSLWNARVKDALERLLADEVCQGRVSLSQAQREIANDWVAAYKRRFHTDMPMPDHARSTEIDDDLELEPPAPARTIARLAVAAVDLRQ